AASGPAYAKYLMRRLKRHKPDLGIILGSWREGMQPASGFANELGNGANEASSFREALSVLISAASLPGATKNRPEAPATPKEIAEDRAPAAQTRTTFAAN